MASSLKINNSKKSIQNELNRLVYSRHNLELTLEIIKVFYLLGPKFSQVDNIYARTMRVFINFGIK